MAQPAPFLAVSLRRRSLPLRSRARHPSCSSRRRPRTRCLEGKARNRRDSNVRAHRCAELLLREVQRPSSPRIAPRRFDLKSMPAVCLSRLPWTVLPPLPVQPSGARSLLSVLPAGSTFCLGLSIFAVLFLSVLASLIGGGYPYAGAQAAHVEAGLVVLLGAQLQLLHVCLACACLACWLPSLQRVPSLQRCPRQTAVRDVRRVLRRPCLCASAEQASGLRQRHSQDTRWSHWTSSETWWWATFGKR